MPEHTHSGHRKRLRERFLKEDVYEHELLELALYYVRPMVNTNAMAHELLEKFRNISGVLNADVQKLQTINGIGIESAVYLKVLFEGIRRYLDISHKNEVFVSFLDIEEYFRNYFGKINSELCVFLTIGASMELLNTVSMPFEQILSGKITRREIVGVLLKKHTYRLVIGVNHAKNSGFPEIEDFIMAKMFSQICSELEIDFIDLVVCCDESAYSMRRHGAFSF